jgi:hypothetical protein
MSINYQIDLTANAASRMIEQIKSADLTICE